MMWLNIFLILFFNDTERYNSTVQTLNLNRCHVYNYFYVSCPVTPPPYAVPIPPDAIEIGHVDDEEPGLDPVK